MKSLRYIITLLLPSGYLCSGFPTVMNNRGGGGSSPNNNDNDDAIIDRRWKALMSNCKGSWSGTIGWLDIHKKDSSSSSSSSSIQIVPRLENNKQNMRLSFYPRHTNPNIADWIVYHARAPNVRQEAILYKHKEEDPMNGQYGPKQTFYCFEGGNLGRSGCDFGQLPVIEHGYWDTEEGMRRSVVLAYDAQTGFLSKICFLQQQKRYGEEEETFDVMAMDVGDVAVMPKQGDTLKEIRLSWEQNKGTIREEILHCTNDDGDGEYTPVDEKDTCQNAIAKLLGDGIDNQVENSNNANDIFRIALPNGVVVACPCCFKTGSDYEIVMGYKKKKSGEIQMTEYSFDRDAKIQKITARWIQKE